MASDAGGPEAMLELRVRIRSAEERSALRGALLAARASELAELHRRGDRLGFGYGSDFAREGMSAEVVQRRLRHEMLDRLIAALDEASR